MSSVRTAAYGLGILAVVTGALSTQTALPKAFAQQLELVQHLESAALVFPVMAPRLSSSYGPRVHPIHKAVRHHNGVDLAAPENSHVRVIAAGRVIFADEYARYGKLVTVEHSGGYVSLYGHLNEIRVNPGDQLRPGSIIGRVGSTGGATGPHLHFELRKQGRPLDPLTIFPDLAATSEG